MDMNFLFVLIPLAPFALAGLFLWTRHQRKMAEIQLQSDTRKLLERGVSNQNLDERLRVVERILTDRRIDLADEIDALRDDRPIQPAMRRDRV
jgi:hypothetical protein